MSVVFEYYWQLTSLCFFVFCFCFLFVFIFQEEKAELLRLVQSEKESKANCGRSHKSLCLHMVPLLVAYLFICHTNIQEDR